MIHELGKKRHKVRSLRTTEGLDHLFLQWNLTGKLSLKIGPKKANI